MEASEEPEKPPEEATPEPAMKVPGFTGLLVLIGLVAAILLARRRFLFLFHI
ncbi:MAG: PGF-CTERM sorting domain-containing protein [Euryarchaeota archaeon]|nr:PGF-CTERM sorting domain-containing protein [Euryarchaeota archaeon]MBU4490897.1 PGF-CTERM sorting domain-containing protein [Euryarchaeota archaeon]